MHFKPTMLACTTLIIALGAVAADAREHRFPISLDDAQARADARFAEADKDASGTLDLGEFEAIDFARGHAKGKRQHKGKGWHHGKGQHHRFHRNNSDNDSDAHVERKAAREARAAAMADEVFALMDVNQDGAISKAEHANADRRQIRKTASKRVRFAHLDANDDGLLTRDELPNRLERLRSADADGDGLVTRDEIRAAKKS